LHTEHTFNKQKSPQKGGFFALIVSRFATKYL